MEVLHVFPGHPLHVLPAQAVLHQQLVELLDLVPSCKCSKERYNQECWWWCALCTGKLNGEIENNIKEYLNNNHAFYSIDDNYQNSST